MVSPSRDGAFEGTIETRNGDSPPILVGAPLLIISDSLLAFDKSLSPIPYSGAFAMSTYTAAQYSIVGGVVAHA
jgi:uncharacterized membrane protein YhhN